MMRARIQIVTIGLATLAAVFAVACGSTPNQAVDTKPISPETLFTCSNCETARLIRVVDGDTLETSVGTIRFYGVDTPERGERCSIEATELTTRMAGTQVRLENGPRLNDRFGRRLAYVYDITGKSLDIQLVRGGFAKAWTEDGQHRSDLINLESSARQNMTGCLWSVSSR